MTASAATAVARPLAERLARRAVDMPVVVTPEARLTAGDLARHGPGPDVTQSDRLALCLTDPAALITALAALDGQVAALLLISPAQPPEVVAALAMAAGVGRIVTDRADLAGLPGVCGLASVLALRGVLAVPVATRWLMTTSGTTGVPKIMPHHLAGLSRTVSRLEPATQAVWGLVYDPTRFAGMQVVLQSLIGGGQLLAPDRYTPLADQVGWLADRGISHLSATPTLWRRLLMVPGLARMPLRQITLGGEIVPQDVLDALGQVFPAAQRTHIYALTEAGVGFAVRDGQAGFPSAYLTPETAPSGMRFKLVEGVLWLRPPAALPPRQDVPMDAEGYLSTGDLVAIEGDRARFLGRESGVINVGGVKVYPEVVERVIAGVPGVRLVRISAKTSPITGALVMAEVMADLAKGDIPAQVALKAAIQTTCRAALEREAVPAVVRFVDDLEINAAGKLTRRSAGAADATRP